jgi:hypothetical protein
VTWLISITAERAVFRSCPVEVPVRKAITLGSGPKRTRACAEALRGGLRDLRLRNIVLGRTSVASAVLLEIAIIAIFQTTRWHANH